MEHNKLKLCHCYVESQFLLQLLLNFLYLVCKINDKKMIWYATLLFVVESRKSFTLFKYPFPKDFHW